MSGGRFEYKQFEIGQIADEIENYLRNMGKKMEDPIFSEEYMAKHYPEGMFHTDYSKETKEKFRYAVKLLREAHVYVQRIDWLLSGDDGEETFHERLKADLQKL